MKKTAGEWKKYYADLKKDGCDNSYNAPIGMVVLGRR